MYNNLGGEEPEEAINSGMLFLLNKAEKATEKQPKWWGRSPVAIFMCPLLHWLIPTPAPPWLPLLESQDMVSPILHWLTPAQALPTMYHAHLQLTTWTTWSSEP